jgi:hypothetical protein
MGAQTGSKENLRFAGIFALEAIVRPNEVALFAHVAQRQHRGFSL